MPSEIIPASQELKRFKCDECDFRGTQKSNLKKHRDAVHLKLKPHSCKLCDFSTYSKAILNDHILSHTGERPFKCDHCSYTCRIKGYLKAHQAQRHEELKPFRCQVCPLQMKTKSQLRQHERIHFPEKYKIFQCLQCSYLGSTKADLNRHFAIHSEDRPFKCPLCSFKTKTSEYLNRHIDIHGGIKPFKCRECELSFRRGTHLKSHIRHRHSDIRPFACPLPECAGKFKFNGELRRHIRSVHNKEKNYHCFFCPSSFYDKGKFEAHVRRHTGEMFLKCELCDFRGCRQEDISNHVLRLHTNLRSFQCRSCSISFKSKRNLTRHEHVHDISRKFPCKHCNYRGVSSSAVKKHDTLSHNREAQTCKCNHCKILFPQRKSLRAHEKVCKAAPGSELLGRISLTEKDCRPCSVLVTRLKLLT